MCHWPMALSVDHDDRIDFPPSCLHPALALCFPQFSMDAVTEVVVDTKPQTKASSIHGSIAL